MTGLLVSHIFMNLFQRKRSTSFPASHVYMMIVHQDHILYIHDEGSGRFVPLFPLEVSTMEAFYTVGYYLGSFFEHSILRDSCSQVQDFQPYVIKSW